jgi:His/Glu/Gln/Arg/opine family amino acid ABC transporter permease subunit
MGKIFEFKFMISTIPEILTCLPITIGLAVVSSLFGLIIALGIAFIRYFHIRVLEQISKVYVSFIRGTPTLVQLFLVYYGSPIVLEAINAQFGTNFNVNGIPTILFAMIAFSFNAGAYMSETIRSAMLSVDAGQLEACYSVNMTTWQALNLVIMPQAFTVALPPLGNSFISMVKDTSLAFSISVIEIMAKAKLIGARSFRFFEVYIVVSVIYWICCFVIEQILYIIERKMRIYERDVAK